MDEVINKDWIHTAPKSITPSGFFGNSDQNIIEIENFMTKEEQSKLLNFIINNDIWDKTETHYDKDGVVLYDHNIWDDRVCTGSSLSKANPEMLLILRGLIERLKPIVEKFFNVEMQDTGPAIVRWRVGDQQHPHADKEFHLGEESGRPNDFPWYDISSLFYINDDYEGGELYFPQHGVEFKPKARAAYFFPGDMNYVHGVRKVTSGTRYTCPFFWTITKHTGEKQPPANFVGGFDSKEYKSLFNN